MEFDHHYVATLQTFMNQKVQVIYEKTISCMFFLRKVSHKGHSLSNQTRQPLPPPKFTPTSSICRAASRSDHVAKMPSWGSKMSSCKAWLKLSSVCWVCKLNGWPLEPWFYMMFYGPLALGKRNTWQRWNLKTLYFRPNWLRKDSKSNISKQLQMID